MHNPFNCVHHPMRADAANYLHLDDPRPSCSSSVLAINLVTTILLRTASSIFHLAFHMAILMIPLWAMLTVVPPAVDWVNQCRERVEAQEEGEEGEDMPWSFLLRYIWREIKLVASIRLEGDQDGRSASPTSVPDFSEELEKLHRASAELDERRHSFEDLLINLGTLVYKLPQYKEYREKRAAVNRALQLIRRAQTPPGEPLPGSLKRENAVTRSAFLGDDTRPREECFDTDGETLNESASDYDSDSD